MRLLKRFHKLVNHKDSSRQKRLSKTPKIFCDLCGDIGNGSRDIAIIHHFIISSFYLDKVEMGKSRTKIKYYE